MGRRLTPFLCCGLFSLLIVGPAQAQTAASAKTARGLIDALIVPALVPGESDVPFKVSKENLTNAIGSALAIGIATAPVSGGSAGLAYLFDATTGTKSLKSASFGPLFLDRPLTSGTGTFNLGFTYSRVSFDRFQGEDLRTTGLQLFDNRVLYKQANYLQFERQYFTLEPDASIFTVYGSYGLTDWLDIGVIVPFANVKVKGSRYEEYDAGMIYPLLTAEEKAFFSDGPQGTVTVDEGEVSASGIGDITIRGMVAFGAQRGQGTGVIGAVRLPTGSEEDLLGTGKTSGFVKFVGSKALGDMASLYRSGGYAFGGLSDEINYGAGVDFALLPRKSLTIAVELLGQNLTDSVSGIASDLIEQPNQTNARFTPPLMTDYSIDRFYFPDGSSNMMRGSVGAKYLLGGNAILSGGVLFPLTDTGLRASTTAFIGLDFSVGRR